MTVLMRVRFTITGAEGLPGIHTTYWRGASTIPVTADCVDVCARVRAFWNAAAGVMAAGVLISGPQSVDTLLDSTGELTGALTPGGLASVAGSGTGSMASATMLLLRLQTTTILGRRRLQGRSYIGPVATTTNSGGNPTTTANATLITAAAQFNTGATASALQVWHRPDEEHPNGGVSADVTGYGTMQEFAVLRSRRN